MAYISTDEIKEIRNELKRALPSYKFSVTRRHHSTAVVSVMEGPIDLTEEGQINHYWIDRNYQDQPEKRDLFNKILSIVGKNYKTEYEDVDYGSIPNYYIHITTGKWDKPYVIKNK
jgi:hypothetical protein